MDLSLTAQQAVVFDREAVRLVLDPGNELKALGIPVDRHLPVMKIQSAGAVKVILDHARHRDRKTEIREHPLGCVDLALPSVHEQKIRQDRKAVVTGLSARKTAV